MDNYDNVVVGEGIQAQKDMRNAGLFFFLLMIMEFPVAILINQVQSMFPAEKEILISVIITQGYLLAAALLFMLITGKGYKKDYNFKKFKLSSFFLSLLVMICAAPMAIWLNVFSQLFVKNKTSAAIFDITQNIPAWLAVIIVGCVPGFIEETIYRGIIFAGYRKYSVLVGVLISSVSFGLMHLNFNQMMYAIYLGLIFAFVVEATGSIVSSMLMHMIFNTVNTAYLYLLPMLYKKLSELGVSQADMTMEELIGNAPSPEEIKIAMRLIAPFALFGVILVVLLIKKMAEINGRTFDVEKICCSGEADRRSNPVGVFLIIGWIICILISINNMK